MRRKVSYRPIEAAIRWSGLEKFERRILEKVGSSHVPKHEDFPRWPTLVLNAERVIDAMENGELRFNAIIADHDANCACATDVHIRHVDLRAWMQKFYPDQRPAFLFGKLERAIAPGVSAAAFHTVVIERETLRTALSQAHAEVDQLRKLTKRGLPESSALPRRSEQTYTHIVGGLLTLLLGQSPGGTPYSSFKTMDAVISALIAHHGSLSGITERTLWAKLGAAKREIAKGNG
jgi:hypothetical protein